MIRTSIVAAALICGIALGAAAQQSGVTVSDAWARATPSGAKTGAAYVTVKNMGTAPDRLVAVSTPVAGVAQLHTMIDDNGVMKMRPVTAIEVKPGASVTLKPGGFHVMLMDLKQPLAEGQSFALTLTFEKAGPVETKVIIAKAGAAAPAAMGGVNMGDMPGMSGK
ncbi:MAG TPA: copper chaperone PCu(A)C [Stellaceae bacterium]|nr:copper chaperone PCu(A)C [Stellaceae bacterium]